VQVWLSEIEEIGVELNGLAPGERRALLVNKVLDLRSEEMIRIVASEVEPGVGGRIIFVPDDELCDEPKIEVREPGEESCLATYALSRMWLTTLTILPL